MYFYVTKLGTGIPCYCTEDISITILFGIENVYPFEFATIKIPAFTQEQTFNQNIVINQVRETNVAKVTKQIRNNSLCFE